GLANPFQAHDDIRAAEALMPHGPVTLFKAWIEMTHRYLAMGIGVLIVALMAQAWRQWWKNQRTEFAPWLPTALFFFVCLQGAFGAWTVTMKLQPVIVTIHLLLGMGLLAMLTWLGGHQDQAVQPLTRASSTAPAMRQMRVLAALAGLLLAVQIALGGWVSTNYATLACLDFPLCHGKLLPEMDFEHGFTLWRALGKTAAGHYLPFPALTAIHVVHRTFALLVFAGIGYVAWRAYRHSSLRRVACLIGIVLALQAFSGLATIYFNWPLAIAVMHNGGAALLVLLLTMLNYRAKFQYDIALRGAAVQGVRAPQAPRPSSPARHPS
ncbi:MAG: cytochrome c oxidase assembly protein subunit 15, partial [Janthinobacterium sp.]